MFWWLTVLSGRANLGCERRGDNSAAKRKLRLENGMDGRF